MSGGQQQSQTSDTAGDTSTQEAQTYSMQLADAAADVPNPMYGTQQGDTSTQEAQTYSMQLADAAADVPNPMYGTQQVTAGPVGNLGRKGTNFTAGPAEERGNTRPTAVKGLIRPLGSGATELRGHSEENELIGPPGEKGAIRPAGPTGEKGAIEPASSGSSGNAGPPIERGPIGPVGHGLPGQTGPQGLMGPQSPPAHPGSSVFSTGLPEHSQTSGRPKLRYGDPPTQQPQTDWRSLADAAANIPNLMYHTMYGTRADDLKKLYRQAVGELRKERKATAVTQKRARLEANRQTAHPGSDLKARQAPTTQAGPAALPPGVHPAPSTPLRPDCDHNRHQHHAIPQTDMGQFVLPG
ncbi:hypothetical protein Bbelb_352780 [Branchiostoma belcheri]|nr:hypothetical protein Bbelb_352780 [Branchiostoma belcheri]